MDKFENWIGDDSPILTGIEKGVPILPLLKGQHSCLDIILHKFGVSLSGEYKGAWDPQLKKFSLKSHPKYGVV